MLKAGARADLSGLASARWEAPQDRRPMSVAEAWGLLKVPSSETGIQTYYRTLLNRPADAESLVQAIEALRLGELARINLIASLALSPEAKLRGRNGAGVLLIRLANSAFERSGLGGRVRRRRARVAAAELKALERRDTRATARPGAPAPGPDTSGLVERVALLEDLLVRTEARVSALQRDRPDQDPATALTARVQALEAAVVVLLQPPDTVPPP